MDELHTNTYTKNANANALTSVNNNYKYTYFSKKFQKTMTLWTFVSEVVKTSYVFECVS